MQETYQVTITYDGEKTGMRVVWPDNESSEAVLVRLPALLSAINDGEFADLMLGAILQSNHPDAQAIVAQYTELKRDQTRMRTRALVPPRSVLKSNGDYDND